MKPDLVDYHCHMDLYPDHEILLHECNINKIATLAVTTTPKAFGRNLTMASHYPHIRVGLGLHPQLVCQRADEISLFEELLPQTRFVGEIGLDAGRQYYSSFKQQISIFNKILQLCAAHSNKILSIHSAYCSGKVLDSIEKHFPQNSGKVVLHWFTGSARDCRRAVELDCYFSINQQMLTNQKYHDMVSLLPTNRVLTETDGPFIKNNDTPIRPKDVRSSVTLLANINNKSYEETATTIVNNLLELER